MRRIHFDLRHIASTDRLEIRVRGKRFPLHPHGEETLAAAAAGDAAFLALPSQAHACFGHFADIAAEQVTGDTPIHVHVVEPEQEGAFLPKVVAMTILIPEAHLLKFWERQLALYTQPLHRIRSLHRHTVRRRPRVFSAKLADLGVTSLGADRARAAQALVKSQYLVTPLDTAGTLVSYHPNLANIQAGTAGNILNNHILPGPDIDPDQYNTMQLLKNAIIAAGSDWSPVIPCTDQNGNQLSAGYDLTDPDGTGIKAGDSLYTYGLADDVNTQLAPACAGANQSASDDMTLVNQTWSPTTGTSSLVSDAGATNGAAAPRAAAPTYKWTVNEQTDHHGVSIDTGSIQIDPSNAFSINAGNTYLRTLYTGYQLLDDAGNPIGSKTKLYSISATNTIMGIPVSTDPTALQFNLGTASSVRLYFGSLGTSDWDEDFSTPGALLTCLWQYGIPIVFMIAGQAITSTATFNKIVNDRDLTVAALGVAFPIVGGGLVTGSALTNTKKVMFSFASAVLSIVVQKGMEALGKWLLAQVKAGAIKDSFGPVGWVLRAAATLMSFEQMAITTGEVLSSPACITATVSRALDVSLTLLPDPRHGEAGKPETAVWPAIARRYVVTLQYKQGTNRKLTGDLPAVTSNTPLPLLFSTVPAGGTFRIIAGVYSASGWLAGSWQSDWLDAVPNQGSTLALGSFSITENLVPLAPDTQYVFKERIVTQAQTFAWQAGSPPTATLTSLNCSAANSLCELVGITLNNSAYQIGYAWRASGQNLPPDSASAPPSQNQLYAMQNLSVLASPGATLKTADIGLTNRPGMAYAPSINPKDQVDQTNFILDPRGSVMNLRQVVLDDKIGSFGLGAPSLASWGQFPLANLDALAIHPSNMVLACSFKDSKLMLLPLPAAPSKDADAPVALLVSGQGIRQGLLRGPKAMTVAPDGRILVLESSNMRVQAFDTKGGPVPSFTPGKPLFQIPTASIGAALDQRKMPDALADALNANGSGFLFTLPTDFVPELDAATFSPEKDPLIAALSQNEVNLAYDPDHMADPTLSASITVVTAGQSWIIRDPRGFAWQVLLQDNILNVSSRAAKVRIEVITAGAQWLVVDQDSFQAWKLVPSSADATQTLVYLCLSFFPLRAARVGTTTFLDMAVEAQGYIYVLSYLGDGSQPSNYILDVYAPDGSFCLRSPDPSVTSTPQNVVAGKIAVDIWRNLYGLTYETLTSPSRTPQPGVGHWTPTPPLFSLALSAQTDLNQMNIGAIVRDFAANGITLSSQAFIVVLDPNGAWQVKDQGTIYHVYRSGGGLQTYAIPV
jgi:hypothetical protein